MLNDQQISQAASDLFSAHQKNEQIGILSVRYPDMTMDDAYRVQDLLMEKQIQAGRHAIGWKIGLTSKAMQSALNIDIPDSGILLDNMLFASGSTVPKGRFIQPRIEAEIAFVMAADLQGESVTRDDVIAATDYVAPALEILDTRILRQDPGTGVARKIVDTIADNAANAGIVMGEKHHAPTAVDLRWVGTMLIRDDEVEETGLGAGVLNDPAMGIVWLAQRLSQYGQSIRAGDIVLSGSFIRPVEATPGSRFYADYGEFGSVHIDFA